MSPSAFSTWMWRNHLFGFVGLGMACVVMLFGIFLIAKGNTTDPSVIKLDLGVIKLDATSGVPGLLVTVLGVVLVAITRPHRGLPGHRDRKK